MQKQFSTALANTRKFIEQNNFLLLAVLAGLIVRFWLSVNLPLWGDEAYSIWVTEQSWLRILNNTADPVHPPGYYTVLKIWSMVSDHLLWFRLLGIVGFITNALLLKKLFAKNNLQQKFAVFLYAFSGYFLIFDWQVRMYTLSLTLILWSLIWQKKHQATKLFWLHLVAFFFDYAFFWYGLFFTACKAAWDILSEKKLTKTAQSLIASLGIFSLWIIFKSSLIVHGVNGIGWMYPYLSPFFHLPYFFGSHLTHFFLLLFLLVAGIGGWQIIHHFPKKKWLGLLIISAVLTYVITLMISLTTRITLFHIRSLQLIPLSILLAMAAGLSWLQKKRPELVLVFMGIFVFNFLVTAYLHTTPLNTPKFVLHFFEWKKLLAPVQQENSTDYFVIGKELEKVPTPLVYWSLQYTLAGKETVGAKPIESRAEISTADDCHIFYQGFFELWRCAPQHQ